MQSPDMGSTRTFESSRIGSILVSQGKLSEEQLQQGLETQKKIHKRLGSVLISSGFISSADLAQALASRLKLEYIELTETQVDPSAAALVGEKMLRRHAAIPLRVEDGRLVVAVSDPTNVYALDDLKMLSGYPIRPVVASEEDIQRVQGKLFAMGEGVSEFLEESAGDDLESQDLDLGSDVGADEAPIIRLVNSILQQASADRASDIHIEPRAKELTVRFRVDGVLREIMSIPTKLQSGVIARIKILGNLNIAERRVPQDGRFSVRIGKSTLDLRVASLPTVYGEKIVLRLLDSASVKVDLRKLGFTPEAFERYQRVFQRPYGAILVTGPTGSGKSTTLYATLNELNSPEKNIITVEDPVEYRIGGINQVQVNTKAGLTFASGLRSILRSDPDIVMIGEIRDFETAKISIEASLTGHLVLATLHTNDAPGALSRLTEMGVEPFLTASAVDCVIAQRLARRLCERCRQPVQIEEEALQKLKFPFELLEGQELQLNKTVGCAQCGGTGYRGRMGLYEVMPVTDEIKEMVVKRAATDEIGRVAQREGMVPLRADGLLKAARGMTTIEEVLRTTV